MAWAKLVAIRITGYVIINRKMVREIERSRPTTGKTSILFLTKNHRVNRRKRLNIQVQTRLRLMMDGPVINTCVMTITLVRVTGK